MHHQISRAPDFDALLLPRRPLRGRFVRDFRRRRCGRWLYAFRQEPPGYMHRRHAAVADCRQQIVRSGQPGFVRELLKAAVLEKRSHREVMPAQFLLQQPLAELQAALRLFDPEPMFDLGLRPGHFDELQPVLVWYLARRGHDLDRVTVPHKDWLKFVKMPRAKTKIKHWL